MDETIRWIACADRMPRENQLVLIAPDVYVGAWRADEWEVDSGYQSRGPEDVTHWAELPRGPRRVGEQS